MATTHDEVKEAADIVNAILARNQAWQAVPPLESRMHSRWVLPELCKVLGLDHLHVKRIELVVDVTEAVQVNVTYFPRQREWPEALRPKARPTDA